MKILLEKCEDIIDVSELNQRSYQLSWSDLYRIETILDLLKEIDPWSDFYMIKRIEVC